MENINTTSKKLNTYKNSEENTIYSNTECRLGFNPTV